MPSPKQHRFPQIPDNDIDDDISEDIPLAPQTATEIFKQEQPAIKNDYDHIPLTFGKYQGKTPNKVAEIDPSWLVWAYNNVKNRVTCSHLLVKECERAVGQRR